jgi:peptidoglycan/LPS O-acetylase OafA/YrhL
VLVWLLCGHFYHENRSFLVIGYPAMAVGSWLLFMSVFRTGFAPRWLRYLGKISYGLYAFHMFAMYLADRLIGGHARNWGKLFVFWGLGMALTIALAAVSYHLFESRLLALKDRFAYVKSRPV